VINCVNKVLQLKTINENVNWKSDLMWYVVPSRGVNQFLLNKNDIEHTFGALIKFEVQTS
jgi:hypothetical protein